MLSRKMLGIFLILQVLDLCKIYLLLFFGALVLNKKYYVAVQLFLKWFVKWFFIAVKMMTGPDGLSFCSNFNDCTCLISHSFVV